MLLWPVLLLMDAILLRVLPGLETDDWLTAVGVAVALLVGTWPVGLLSVFIDVNSTWIFLGVACAANSVILTLATMITTGFRAQSAVALPVAGALIAAVNYYVGPVVVAQVMAASHAHWF